MPIPTDKILTECADQAYEAARLGRNSVHTPPEPVYGEMLSELESTGDAMRFVDTNSRTAWKATPRLRNRLTDLELDAQNDLEDF